MRTERQQDEKYRSTEHLGIAKISLDRFVYFLTKFVLVNFNFPVAIILTILVPGDSPVFFQGQNHKTRNENTGV